ncbi:MAG: hypothetical protein KDB72_05435 [Mycobacterium sp.]|nr:hypothetical protein [Mycobacterium sp.]
MPTSFLALGHGECKIVRGCSRSAKAVSHDPGAQRRLWALSEELTGVVYPV